MKFCITIIIIGCTSLQALAQQRPQHTQYFQNNYLLNPAVAGIESYTDVRLGYSSQWIGMEGAPVSYYASAQTALGKNDRNIAPVKEQSTRRRGYKSAVNKNNRFFTHPHHGIGIVAQKDRAGLLATTSLNVSYAYHLPLTRNLNLSSGLTTGILQYRLNKNEMQVQTPNDPFVYGNFSNMNKLDLGLGLWLYNRDFYVGLAGLQLLRSKNDLGGMADAPKSSLQPHFYATTGYRFAISESLTAFPSVMVKKADKGETAVDVNAKILYGQRFWGGLSYRHHDATSAMAGIYLNHMFDVSYSYDFTTSELNRASVNSHEVVVGIRLNNPQKVICPQWSW